MWEYAYAKHGVLYDTTTKNKKLLFHKSQNFVKRYNDNSIGTYSRLKYKNVRIKFIHTHLCVIAYGEGSLIPYLFSTRTLNL